MVVNVLPIEYLLHVLLPAGLKTEFPSSNEVLLDPIVLALYSFGRDRLFELHREAMEWKSGRRLRTDILSEGAFDIIDPLLVLVETFVKAMDPIGSLSRMTLRRTRPLLATLSYCRRISG